MIAVDSCTLIAYLQGDPGWDVEALEELLAAKQVVVAPVVLTEVLSDGELAKDVKNALKSLPTLDILDGYWERAGAIRAVVLGKKHKARVADALIAQSCLDHRVSLLTRDGDFNAFAKHCGLNLLSDVS